VLAWLPAGFSCSFFVTQYYADYNGDNRVDALGYKNSQHDKTFQNFNWDAAYRFSKGLTVSAAAAAADDDVFSCRAELPLHIAGRLALCICCER
jgi:hypothetical protein